MQLEDAILEIFGGALQRRSQGFLVHVGEQFAKPCIGNFDEVLEREHLVANRRREIGVLLLNSLKDVRRNLAIEPVQQIGHGFHPAVGAAIAVHQLRCSLRASIADILSTISGEKFCICARRLIAFVRISSGSSISTVLAVPLLRCARISAMV